MSITALKANVNHTKMTNKDAKILEREGEKKKGGKSLIMQMSTYPEFVTFLYFFDSELQDPSLPIM